MFSRFFSKATRSFFFKRSSAFSSTFRRRLFSTSSPFKSTFAKASLASASAFLLAASPFAQSTVYSGGRDHAGYLWIKLSSKADKKEVARVLASITKITNDVIGSVPTSGDEDDGPEAVAGVAFSPDFWNSVAKPSTPVVAEYKSRKGRYGSMPATGGDCFVHVKSDNRSHPFRVFRELRKRIPAEWITEYNDTYGWVYRNGRDLSESIDGTENPAEEEDRADAALLPNGGSYLITQVWKHDTKAIDKLSPDYRSVCVGRLEPNSVAIEPVPSESHVERMVFNKADGKKANIVRQSMPYGTLSGDHGLFFIAYCNDVGIFDRMLDRMTGLDGDGKHDRVMELSRCVKGNYWYVPEQRELSDL